MSTQRFLSTSRAKALVALFENLPLSLPSQATTLMWYFHDRFYDDW